MFKMIIIAYLLPQLMWSILYFGIKLSILMTTK